MGIKDLLTEYDKDLRSRRIEVYADLWKQLKILSRYDLPEPLNAATLKKLTISMRDWYFDTGGMYLSEDTRPVYFELKRAIQNVIETHKDQPEKPLEPEESQPVLDLAHDLRTRLAIDVGTRKTSFTNVARADPSNIQQVAATQLELINTYYTTILEQAVQSFRWAMIAAGIGLAFFIFAVAFMLVSQQSSLPTLSVISGALVEVISGINFYLYGKALAQLELFHVRLERTQRFLLSNSVCEQLKGAEQQAARVELVRTISSLDLEIHGSNTNGKVPQAELKVG